MSIEYKITVAENGRLVIPSKIRKKLNIVHGDKVIIMLDEDLKIIPLKQNIKKFQEVVKSYNKKNISLVDSLIASRREEAKNE